MDIQPYTSTETLAVGRPWLMSMLGIKANQSVTLDLAAFDEDTHWLPPTAHQPERKLKSGIPLGRISASGLFGPYDSAASDGTQTFAGFLFTEIAYAPTSTKAAAPLMVHGQIDAEKLPVPFDPTALAAGSNTQFVYKV
ncbi:MAG TPA: head decoration protein [Streptomyces sp.]|nr:head decoration protein [Streptomyces sp.]